MGPAWAFGGGVGYDPAGPHRFDFTIDYESPSRFEGNLTCTSVTPPCGAPSYSIETADITAWTGLFNAYLDFGGHPYFKPYIGVGAGFSALTTTNVISVDPTPATTIHTGATHWNFAWALMAGITKDVTPTLKLDIGYRYLNLGEARSGIITDALSQTGFFQYQHIQAHELRIGLRHML
jgi:opacity protein-like surface antigen